MFLGNIYGKLGTYLVIVDSHFYKGNVMKRKDLLASLETLGVVMGITEKEYLASYWMLHEFIIQNTKEEEKIPSLLKGVENDT